jgi:hypothetical protein
MSDQRLLGVMERKESRTETTMLDRQDETRRWRLTDVGVILSATPVPLQFNDAGGTGGETLEDNAAQRQCIGKI